MRQYPFDLTCPCYGGSDKSGRLADSVAAKAGRGGPGERGLSQIKGGIMHWVWIILMGFVVGVLAKLLHPGRDNMGFIMTTLLGIAGSLLAGTLGQLIGWYQAGQGAGFIGSLVGAIVILVIYGMLKGRSGSPT
jgi:uncharacterized membrane protein YeaQ/YmgE (transglycosylase-associated protein family)